MSNFKKELISLLNHHSKENDSNTPDFILAEYLIDCLEVFNKTVMRRSDWYGDVDQINSGNNVLVSDSTNKSDTAFASPVIEKNERVQ